MKKTLKLIFIREFLNQQKFIIFLILFINAISISAQNQGIKGLIRSDKGEAVPFATVFIQNLKTGTAANANGDYEFKLPQGYYKVEYRSVGYRSVIKEIKVDNDFVICNVTLSEDSYAIDEVVINKSDEDPAYGFMRKAIALAPYYRRVVMSYESEAYVKGSLHIAKLPGIIRKSVKLNEQGVKAGDSYTSESRNHIVYKAPGRYVQNVLSAHSNFPKMGAETESVFNISQANIYAPVFVDCFSPFHPSAFRYYRFKYLGSSIENGKRILKIQVIPRMESQKMFKGNLFLLDDEFSVYSFDFVNERQFGQITIKQVFANVNRQMWMPVTYYAQVNFKMYGIDVLFTYHIVQNYSVLKLNNHLPKPAWAVTDKEQKEVDTPKNYKILSVQKPSRRQYRKLTREMNKISNDSIKRIEVKDKEDAPLMIRYEKNAIVYDSSYWNKNRPVPLLDFEKKQLLTYDSVKRISPPDSLIERKITYPGVKTSNLLFGGIFSKKQKSDYHSNGLLSPLNISFTPTDGFLYQTSFRYQFRPDTINRFMINPEIGFSFARNRIYASLETGWGYSYQHNGWFSAKIGKQSVDFAGDNGQSPLLNTLTCLFLKENYIDKYENKFIQFNNYIETNNGFSISVSAAYEKKSIMENISDYSFLRKNSSYAPNLVDVDGFRSFTTGLSLSYTVNARYAKNGEIRKIKEGSSPVLMLDYKRGWNKIVGSDSNFDFIKLGIKQSISGDLNEKFEYSLYSGFFPNHNSVYYSDRYHPICRNYYIAADNSYEAFAMLPAYASFTNDMFAEGHLHYRSDYLFFKFLPLMSKTNFTENVYLHYYRNNSFRNYWEVGYALGKLVLGNTELGIFSGFAGSKFKSVQLRWSLGF